MSPALEERLDRYVREISSRGERVNLVGRTDPAAIRVHVEDSLVAAGVLPRGADVVDLGSGAGFPGVPVSLARPDLRVTLVEIRERRVHFLRHVARALPVEVEILRQRIEDPPSPPRFDVALLRAVAPLPRSVELGRAWVRAGGSVWIWTREGPGALSEEDRPRADAIPLGAGRGSILRVTVTRS